MSVPARGGVRRPPGTYNPYAAGAPLTLYATGVRNAFDLVWHSNGHLYAGTNGSAAGGNTPATPTTLPASCANRPDGGYTAPDVAGDHQQPAGRDRLRLRREEGQVLRPPEPERCEYVLNAGNPTGYTGNPLFKVNAYPAGSKADPNYDLAGVYDAGLHASANGTVEYQNTTAFGGALAGKLLVVRYSANQEIVAFNVNARRQPVQGHRRHHRLHRPPAAAGRRPGRQHRQPLRHRADRQPGDHRHQAAQAAGRSPASAAARPPRASSTPTSRAAPPARPRTSSSRTPAAPR